MIRNLRAMAAMSCVCFAVEPEHTSTMDLGGEEDTGQGMRIDRGQGGGGGRADAPFQPDRYDPVHASADVQRQSIDQNTIRRPEEQRLPPAPTAARGMPKTTRIVLEEDENMAPTGQTFGYNGQTFLIRPGEEVDVPDGLIGILNDAKMSVPIVDPKSKQVIGYRDRLRFNYRVVR